MKIAERVFIHGAASCILVLLLFTTPTTSLAQVQTLIAHGTIGTSALPARYAAVTYIDKSDTAKMVTVVTDTSGRYSVSVVTSATHVEAPPAEFRLEQNYPNPFIASTEISYQINKQSDVTVTVYDILGREVRRFSAGIQGAGVHGVLWDGKNSAGEVVARGIYFYQLRVQNETLVRKMLYGFGGNEMLMPSAGALSSTIAGEAVRGALVGSTFIVRVANTDSTFPPVIAQQFDNVNVQNNATLDFSVSADGTFPDPSGATIYPDDTQQLIRGFGAANILQWRPDMTAAQTQKAFGNGPGQIGFTILRLRVPYDPSGTAFSMQIPTAKLAQSLGAIVFASPWTPPPAMKSNNNIVGGILNENSYANFAAYLRSFVDYMSANGAPLYAVSLQNEPDANVTYESCSWNGTQFLNFMKNNASSIGTRVMMPESQNFVHALSDPTLNDSLACANTSIIAGHLYGGGLGAYPLATGKGKEFWMTEYLDLDTAWAGASGSLATGVLSTGKQISDCMKAGMNAYVWWYLVRYYGPINESGNVTKRGYVMSQFARFVRPGFLRVNAVDFYARTLVDVTAYRQGSKIVIVAINRNATAKNHSFVLWNGTKGSCTPYITSGPRNCEQQSDFSYKNGMFKYTLEPLSVTTFVMN